MKIILTASEIHLLHYINPLSFINVLLYMAIFLTEKCKISYNNSYVVMASATIRMIFPTPAADILSMFLFISGMDTPPTN